MALDVQSILVKLSAKHNKKFTYQDNTLTLEQTFAPDGGLPILVKRANLLADFLFGESLQVNYPTDPDAMTGETVVISDNQNTFILVMLLYDVVEELVVNATDDNIILS